MATTIAGLFDDLTQAREAVRELVDNGFPRDTISLMANDQSSQRKAVELDDEQASQQGGTLVLVDVQEDRAGLVSDILKHHHPVDLEQRAGEWKEQKWSGNKEGSQSFLFDHSQKPNKLRESRSELDYGPGAATFLPGKAVDQYDRSQADLSNYQNRQNYDWLTFQSRFAEHFKTNYGGTDKRWEVYRDAYHFGFDSGKDPRFSNQVYPNVEDEIQHLWEMNYPDRPWADYQEAVHAGWEGGHVPS